jgi:hypothetical protein
VGRRPTAVGQAASETQHETSVPFEASVPCGSATSENAMPESRSHEKHAAGQAAPLPPESRHFAEAPTIVQAAPEARAPKSKRRRRQKANGVGR